MKEYTAEELKALDRAAWSEEIFQNRLMEQLEGLGFLAVHFLPALTGRINKKTGKPHIRTPYQGRGKGFPDTVGILLKQRKRADGIAWELKVGKNVATPEQLRWLAHFEAMGFDTRVCYPRDWDWMMDFLRS